MADASRLWLTLARREWLRREIAETPDWVQALGRVAAEPMDSLKGLVRRAVHGLLGQANDPALVPDWLAAVEKTVDANDLHKAHVALVGAVLADCLLQVASPAEKAGLGKGLSTVCSFLLRLSDGNPHAVGNNWWAVTHSAFYCACSARVALESGAAFAGRPAVEWEEWSWHRLRAFLGHFGPSGAYHEGLGYEAYTGAYLFPALSLRMARSGESHEDVAPGLRRMAALFFTAAVEGPAWSDETSRREGWGRMLSWNDAGLGWPEGSAPLFAALFAPTGQRGSYLHLWDRLAGHLRPDGEPDEAHASLFFQIALRGDLQGCDPLPDQVCDALHGLWVARSQRINCDDAVAGASARGVHFGGHSHQDAGSIRFSALGWDWILGGGQARGNALWQSRLVPSDQDKQPAACGAVIWAPTADGSKVFGMDLRAVHRAYSERYVALRSGTSAHLAVLDVVDDHRVDRHWEWALTFSPELTCEWEDGAFRLTAPDGSSMEGVFLLDRPVAFELRKTPVSHRTYADGTTRTYAERPVLVARFGGPSLNIYTSLRVTRHPAGRVALACKGCWDLAVDGELWERPFSLAVPQTYSGRLGGFCKRPVQEAVYL